MKKMLHLATKEAYEVASDVTTSVVQEVLDLALKARSNNETEVIVETPTQDYVVIFPNEETPGKITLG